MFRVSLDLSDDEVTAYETIVERIASSSVSPRAHAGLITMGCIVAFACAALLYSAGAVSRGGGAAMTALVFGAYWLGAWAPSILSWAAGRQRAATSRDQVQRGLQGAVLVVGAHRLAMVGAGWRTALDQASIDAVTTEGGLTLIWRSPDLDIYPFAVVPTRRLTPAQQAELAAFAAPPSSGQDRP